MPLHHQPLHLHAQNLVWLLVQSSAHNSLTPLFLLLPILLLLQIQQPKPNQNLVRCANIAKSPRRVDVAELCPKCRPFTLGLATGIGTAGKRVREYESEVLEGSGTGGWGVKNEDEDDEALGLGKGKGKGDIRNKEEKEDKDEEMKNENKDKKTSPQTNGQDMNSTGADPVGRRKCTNPNVNVNGTFSPNPSASLPTAMNGDAEIPSFSIFKRVLGAMAVIPGSPSSSSSSVDLPSESKTKTKTDVEADESGKGKDGQGGGQKQSWLKVEEDPDWEIVGRENSY